MERVPNDGIMIVATDGIPVMYGATSCEATILNEEGVLSSENRINGHLSIANLHYHYWKHDRIFAQGYMNNVLTNFTTYQKIKQIKDLSFPICCNVDFDITETVTTELGTAEVQEAEYFPFDYKLNLKLNI